MLFNLNGKALEAVTPTTFAAEGVQERQHLQAALRDQIGVISDDLLVIAEEFGGFVEANRRIDLLCLDRDARIVVVELKRTDDGSHMELQALRYAAMVSVMTFDDVTAAYAGHLEATGDGEHDEEAARDKLLEWLELDEEPAIPREVGIVLVSANFSREVTSTVLWLNEFYGMDVTCIRLSPYRHGGAVLLDVQQVVPLPEAAGLMVQIKRKEAAARVAKESSKDFTKYVVTTLGGQSGPLAKKRAMLAYVRALANAGVDPHALQSALREARFKAVPGVLEGDELWTTFMAEHDQKPDRRKRWFVDEAIHAGDHTWVLFSNWGNNTDPTLSRLAVLAPADITCEPVTPDVD